MKQLGVRDIKCDKEARKSSFFQLVFFYTNVSAGFVFSCFHFHFIASITNTLFILFQEVLLNCMYSDDSLNDEK